MRYVKLSATTSGIPEVKEVVKVAKNELKMFKRKTILFVDEIHRFNKLQQDAFLPHVENGTIVLLGATTENPSFHVNNALLSRCKVVVLEKLSVQDIESILNRALDFLKVEILNEGQSATSRESEDGINRGKFFIEQNAVKLLVNLCDGDARSALNGLQIAFHSHKCKETDNNDRRIITAENIKEGFQRSHVLYDKTGDEHFNIISALHKSVRGSDSNAALYWLARMTCGGEQPLYIARRLVRMASEDIGLADPGALTQAVATYQACHFLGMPECDVILAQCVVYLCRAPKSVEVYSAFNAAKSCVRGHQGALPGVPLHIRNASTKLMSELGYGKGYKYNPSYPEPVDQEYLPPELAGTNFF